MQDCCCDDVVVDMALVIVPGEDFRLPMNDFIFSSDTDRIVVPIEVMDPDPDGERAETIRLCIGTTDECATITLLDDDSAFPIDLYTVVHG